MSGIYASARSALWQGGIDVMSDPVRAILVGPGYTYDEADTVLADLTDVIGTGVIVTIDAVTAGEVTCDPVTFVAVPDAAVIAGIVTYIEGTNDLIGYADRRADSVPLNPTAATGGDITFTFVDYLLKI